MSITVLHPTQEQAASAMLSGYDLKCHWPMLRSQLLEQWTQLSESDLDVTGPNAPRIAALIESKYGISSQLVENYLANFVRTMPWK